MKSAERDIFRQFSYLKFAEIWHRLKQGEELEGEEAVIGRAMQEHEEYYNTWEFADELADMEYDPETEVDPFLHILVHTVIENQLKADAPKGVKEVYNRLMARGIDRHEVIHKMGSVFTGELWEVMKFMKPFNEERYLKKLRRIR